MEGSLLTEVVQRVKMHCLILQFPHSLWSGFVSSQIRALKLKLNVTGLPGSESRGRRGGGVRNWR